jgi:serine/threonine protein kinase
MEKSQPPLKGDGAYDFNRKRSADFIAKGGFGYVFKAIRKHDQQIFAIKISKEELIYLDPNEIQDLTEEIRLMKNFPHQFIVKIIDDFIDSEDRQCIVQELYTQGDFKKFLNDRNGELFNEEDIIHFLSNIIMVVHHLNSRGIYHRDLKPENFLIKSDSNGNIFLHLSDFGCAKNSNPEYARITTEINIAKGSPEYLAPELLQKD